MKTLDTPLPRSWTAWSILPVFITLLISPINATDPVYSPQTLNDSVGNFADNTSTLTWASLPEGESYAASSPSRISAGLTAFYDMVHGFVSAVFSKGFPDGM